MSKLKTSSSSPPSKRWLRSLLQGSKEDVIKLVKRTLSNVLRVVDYLIDTQVALVKLFFTVLLTAPFWILHDLIRFKAMLFPFKSNKEFALKVKDSFETFYFCTCPISSKRYKDVQDIVPDPEAPPDRHSKRIRFFQDIILVLTAVLPCFAYILIPLRPYLLHRDATVKGLAFQILLTFCTILWYVPVRLIVGDPFNMPDMLDIETFWNWQGPQIIRVDTKHTDDPISHFEDEAWFFVNGICTSQSGVKLILDHLQKLFHRPIIGLHNRTLGPLFDLLDCVIQRDLHVLSLVQITNIANAIIGSIVDEKIKKIVLIGHSQGGLIISQLLDHFISIFPQRPSKVEIYTFASAANNFPNPLMDTHNRLFKHVEHYANGKDPVARIGVLAYCMPKTIKKEFKPSLVYTQHDFYGRLFVRPKYSGHMLFSH